MGRKVRKGKWRIGKEEKGGNEGKEVKEERRKVRKRKWTVGKEERGGHEGKKGRRWKGR